MSLELEEVPPRERANKFALHLFLPKVQPFSLAFALLSLLKKLSGRFASR
jgi:hypothetical protein